MIKKTKASTAIERAFSIEGVARRELSAVGWKAEVGAGGTIWQNLANSCWYDELRALALLKEGVDPGDSA